jgi:RNA polymerase sigma factor (sigma-70 family)
MDSIINHSEGAMVTYLHKSIHNSYIKQSVRNNKLRKILLYSDLSETDLYRLETSLRHQDDFFYLDINSFEQILTTLELKIIKMVYFDDFTVPEIASALKKSRQAVNQTKKRAIRKLKKLYFDKPDD